MVVLCAAPLYAVDMSFQQITWLDRTGAYLCRWSDWGQVKITFNSADGGLFHPMTVQGMKGYGGFVNIVSDASGSASWEVKNLPIFYLQASEFDGRLPQGVTFDLGVTRGTQVTSLNYYYSVDQFPLASMPSGTYANKQVTEFVTLSGGDILWMAGQLTEGAGAASPVPAADFPGA